MFLLYYTAILRCLLPAYLISIYLRYISNPNLNNMSPKVWLITGTSSGFGSLLVKAALNHGDKVIATARDASKIEDLKALGAATLALDVVDDEENIKRVIADAVAVYGRIDILVNNAAYILAGAVEESR